MAAAGFDVLLTVDQGIPHQQNLRGAGLAAVLMFGASNQLADFAPLVPHVLTALGTSQSGDVVEVRTLCLIGFRAPNVPLQEPNIHDPG
jgi:hypothetical protein